MKHWLRLILIGAFLGIFGCAGVMGRSIHYTSVPSSGHLMIKSIPLYVDEQFSVDDKLAIDNAVGAWNYALNGYIVLDVRSYHFDMQMEQIREAYASGGVLVMKVKSDNPIIPDDNPLLFRTLAWVNELGGHKLWVVRDRIYSEQRLQDIVEHELGHVLRVEHINTHPSIMQGVYKKSNYECIDKWAIEAVAECWGLPFRELNYCYYDGDI